MDGLHTFFTRVLEGMDGRLRESNSAIVSWKLRMTSSQRERVLPVAESECDMTFQIIFRKGW